MRVFCINASFPATLKAMWQRLGMNIQLREREVYTVDRVAVYLDGSQGITLKEVDTNTPLGPVFFNTDRFMLLEPAINYSPDQFGDYLDSIHGADHNGIT
jgi:hypothetical protein